MTVNFRLPINFKANRERDFTAKIRNLAKRVLPLVFIGCFVYLQN